MHCMYIALIAFSPLIQGYRRQRAEPDRGRGARSGGKGHIVRQTADIKKLTTVETGYKDTAYKNNSVIRPFSPRTKSFGTVYSKNKPAIRSGKPDIRSFFWFKPLRIYCKIPRH